jgi:hypothetical protein
MLKLPEDMCSEVKWTEITRPSPHFSLCLNRFAFKMQTYDFAKEKTLVRLAMLRERDQSPRPVETVDGIRWMTLLPENPPEKLLDDMCMFLPPVQTGPQLRRRSRTRSSG